ncbi:hypothetical protein C9374_010502 [Naegleria lovaniensis]|uniref:Uncharacterized protein n=1 Tax=Naegleria lovaniensis TaxID=51637 RepID=A0AA88GH37_NAELO|nr:uncharacterized protein C9374_010502 [Naegleria lovaniensis]KAG2374758.1 hypothetical protein C9374_010502 [Naegleria lovaniensis]
MTEQKLLLSLDPNRSTIEMIGTVTHEHDKITPIPSDLHDPSLEQYLTKRGIYGIKTIIARTSFLYVLTDSGHLLEFSHNTSDIVEHILEFVEPNEKIVNISAGYALLLVVLQDQHTLKTRVFGKNSSTSHGQFQYAKNVKQHAQTVMSLTARATTSCSSPWYEVLDFQHVLDVDEYIIFTSCAAYTATFISNKGRIAASGSNQFGECASGSVCSYQAGVNQTQVMECKIENCDSKNSKPFFVRSVNGDHTIVALTRDNRVFYCGYTLNRGSDLSILRELPSPLDIDEYFIDIASCYYSTLILTNKHKLYSVESHKRIYWTWKENITRCSIFASPSLFFIVVNDSKIFTYSPESITKETNLTVNTKLHGSRLCLTASDNIIMYWQKHEESKSLRRMKETLLKSLNNVFLQDVTVVQL